jgi:hypothetical protein
MAFIHFGPHSTAAHPCRRHKSSLPETDHSSTPQAVATIVFLGGANLNGQYLQRIDCGAKAQVPELFQLQVHEHFKNLEQRFMVQSRQAEQYRLC